MKTLTDSFSSPCSGYGGKPGCGETIYFTKNDVTGKWNKPTNRDGSPHSCGGGIVIAAEPMSGLEQAQANSNTERILNVVIPKMVDLQKKTCQKVHDEVQTVTSLFNSMNVDFTNYARNTDKNIKDIVTGLEIKKKIDYRSDGEAETLEDKFNQANNDMKALNENFDRFARGIEALLVKNSFCTAGELYEQRQEQSQLEQ